MGLVLGGMLGGTLAMKLIDKYDLRPEKTDVAKRLQPMKNDNAPKQHKVSVEAIIDTIFALAIFLMVGKMVNGYLFNNEINLPGFLTAMLVMYFQITFSLLFSGFIIFRMMGKDYDAAIVAGGFFGLSIGATPVAMASIDNASKKMALLLKR